MTAPLLLGIELGGTKLQLGLGHGDGRVVELLREGVDPAADAAAIRGQVAELVTRWPVATRSRIAAAGIGFGGPVDTARGRTTTSNQVAGWDDFPLAAWASQALGVAVVALGNDSDTAALGEARFGAGVGLSPVLYVNSGSGVGGGLIIDGRIYRGAGQGAIEIGHLWIDDPDDSTPGRPRTVERAASGWAIGEAGRELVESQLRAGSPPGRLTQLAGGVPASVTGRLVGIAAEQGDPDARAILRAATLAFARGLAHAVTLLAPRRIILGGGVSLMPAELWLGPIRTALASYVFPPFRDTYDVVPAALGEEVVLHGALALAADALGDRLEHPRATREPTPPSP